MKYCIILLQPERRDREKYHIGFPSLTLQNPEEGGNKPPKRWLRIKKDSYNSLPFFELWTASSKSILR